jgi:hypothetical protein
VINSEGAQFEGALFSYSDSAIVGVLEEST